MAESTGKILEGVFAINKPPSVSSAQVIRDLQTHFKDSRLFAPLVQQTLALKDAERRDPKRRRTSSGSQNLVKMGHGGTLDPMATGVLIIGVGAGTKRLPDFLLSKKTYDTTVLFGKSSDTYDIVGKNVAEAPYEHITRELVEEKMERFRGKIKQIPPIYSALKINGMKAYEYARSGKELPRELESREMEVTECELLEYYEGGYHDYRWPADEAGEEEKTVVRKFLGEPEPLTMEKQDKDTGLPDADASSKVKADDVDHPNSSAPTDEHAPSIRKVSYNNRLSPEAKAALHTHDIPVLSSTPCPAPAARIRLTVSSGFYVRSFAHDLGRAVGSMGMMASLIRSRQADFSCIADETDTIQTLTYDELQMGEETWGPRVESMLQDWARKHPPTLEEEQKERAKQKEREGLRGFTPKKRAGDGYHDRDRNAGQKREGRDDRRRYGSDTRGERDFPERRRRNSSSPE